MKYNHMGQATNFNNISYGPSVFHKIISVSISVLEYSITSNVKHNYLVIIKL